VKRGIDEDGRRLLPTKPIISRSDGHAFGMPYPDMIAAKGDAPKVAPKPARKAPTRAG
jgi:hypothetical protein